MWKSYVWCFKEMMCCCKWSLEPIVWRCIDLRWSEFERGWMNSTCWMWTTACTQKRQLGAASWVHSKTSATSWYFLVTSYILIHTKWILNGSRWDMLRFKDQGRVGPGHLLLPVQLLPCAAALGLCLGVRQRGLSILAKCWWKLIYGSKLPLW